MNDQLGGSSNLETQEDGTIVILNGCTYSEISKMKNLLHNCLLAFNEMPNKALNGIGGYPDTYSIAKEINRVTKP